MGVPGLWDLLRPAAARTSLSTLARDASHANRNGLRAFTIGIDASIWIFHAQIPVHGENPFVRTIFYKIATLLQHPVLPVFVFDGPNKPGRKRNERVAGQFGTYDWRSRRFKELLDVCGLEWWNAPGEAEAELAVMNRQGKIDAVLSDDVDALLFGATCLLRNNSPTLSGAQASSTQSNSSRGDARHYEVYRSSAVLHEWASRKGTSLVTEEDCRRAMVLVALLSGGDYAPEGLTQFGATISFALANAGLADFLKLYQTDPSAFATDLSFTHGKMVDELRTNSTGHLGRRYPDRAGKLASRDPASLFPAFALDAYLQPCTSPADDPSRGWPGFGRGESSSGRGKSRNEGRGDLEGMAKACEKYFEWGTKEIVGKKFASESVGIFSGQVVNEAREAMRRMTPAPVLNRESAAATTLGFSESASGPSRITSFFQQSTSTTASKTTPLEPRKTPAHILRIHSIRKDPTAAELNEYRISYQHDGYLSRCHGAMAGTRCDPSDLPMEERAALGLVDRNEDDAGPAASQAPAPGAPKSELRVWVAEYLVREAWPELVAAYEEELRAKADRLKSPRKKTTGVRNVVRGKTRRAAGGGQAAEDTDRFKSFFTQKQGARASRSPTPEEAVEELEDLPPRFSSTIPTSPKRSASGKSASPVAPKQSKAARARPSSSPPSSVLSLTLSVPPGRELDISPSPTPVIRRTRPRRKSARVTSSSPAPSSAGNPALPTSGIPPASKRTTAGTSAAPPTNDIPRGPSKSNRTRTQKGKKDEPIDLCSTDDEALPPMPRRSPRNAARSSSTLGRTASTTSSVLAGSSRANEQVSSSPPSNRHTGTKKNTTKTNTTSQNDTTAKGKAKQTDNDGAQTGTLQTLLGLPVVSRGTAIASGPAVKGSQVGEGGKLGKTKKKGRVSYVVTYENSDWEEIDSTRGR